MTTAYVISDKSDIDMPNVDADLIFDFTEQHLPEGRSDDADLKELFEIRCLLNVVPLDGLTPAAFMSFHSATLNAFEWYKRRGPADDGKINNWHGRVCETWQKLIQLMENDPRFAQSKDPL